ncbi:MAG: DUF1704 domain-containing protein [Myxococcales bacterium]|nr:DUF1704 domain-containing protein [Myxococcales bacterium]
MVPPSLRDADRSLRELARRVQLLGALSPNNFGSEVARLERAWARGDAESPAFTYAPAPDLSDVPEVAARLVEQAEGNGALGRLYQERAGELALEAELIGARETPAFPALAQRRFDHDKIVMEEADRLAAEWGAGEEETSGGPVVRTDDESDPRSLVRRARAELGRLRLPVRITVVASLAPLAAAGDRLLQIAAARDVSLTDVERTVMHEVHGHLLPMHRASVLGSALLEVGSAGGSEGQEGYALLLEHRCGFLRGARARELALRHVAARAAHRGEPFPAIVRLLLGSGASTETSIRIAARAVRGGGLGREAGYLPSYLAVSAAVSRSQKLEEVLASGRLSVTAAEVLQRFLPAATS